MSNVKAKRMRPIRFGLGQKLSNQPSEYFCCVGFLNSCLGGLREVGNLEVLTKSLGQYKAEIMKSNEL